MQLFLMIMICKDKTHYKSVCIFFALFKFFFLAGYLTGCLDLAGGCETEISRRIPSPGKNLQAITTITDCGATTSVSYGVRIVEGYDTTDDGDRDDAILGSNKGVDIFWVSDDTLIIKGADTTNGHLMKTRLKLKNAGSELIILYEK